MTVTPEQLQRLPKFAQSEIELLRMRVREAEARIEALSADVPEDRCIVIGQYREPEHRVPARENIEFRYGGEIGQYFGVYLRGDRLTIRGGRQFMIHPGSTNTIELEAGER